MKRAAKLQPDRVSVQRRPVSQLLDEARSRIDRVEPSRALADIRNGALLIDIRADTDRERNGIVPGSLHIPRTVLEWRLDPDSEWRSPYVTGLDQHIILLCDHGYSSSLAASTLADLGFQHVGDLIGGFEAWRNAGLPVGLAPPPRPTCELAGMRSPDSVTRDNPPPSLQQHWDNAFARRGITGVSWYEPTPSTSLTLIKTLDVHPDAAVIDVGAGASRLVDCLLGRGFSDISVLDVSDAALRVVSDRLPHDAPLTCISADVLTWRPHRAYSLWHDRAMFHFLVSAADRRRYLETLLAALEPGGAVIIGAFAREGPDRCSGLPVQRYSADELAAALGHEFQVLQTRCSDHQSPDGVVQPFTWIAARRREPRVVSEVGVRHRTGFPQRPMGSEMKLLSDFTTDSLCPKSDSTNTE